MGRAAAMRHGHFAAHLGGLGYERRKSILSAVSTFSVHISERRASALKDSSAILPMAAMS